MNGTTETGGQRKDLAAQARCHGVQRRARDGRLRSNKPCSRRCCCRAVL